MSISTPRRTAIAAAHRSAPIVTPRYARLIKRANPCTAATTAAAITAAVSSPSSNERRHRPDQLRSPLPTDRPWGVPESLLFRPIARAVCPANAWWRASPENRLVAQDQCHYGDRTWQDRSLPIAINSHEQEENRGIANLGSWHEPIEYQARHPHVGSQDGRLGHLMSLVHRCVRS